MHTNSITGHLFAVSPLSFSCGQLKKNCVAKSLHFERKFTTIYGRTGELFLKNSRLRFLESTDVMATVLRCRTSDRTIQGLPAVRAALTVIIPDVDGQDSEPKVHA